MSLGWRLKRLRAMSLEEIAHRFVQASHLHLEGFGIGLAKPSLPEGACGASWAEPIPRAFSPAPYIAAADRILAGRFNVLALDSVQLGFPPEWNRDPLTGVAAPLTFGKGIDYRDAKLVGDIKYLWEINRHLELVTLAQAWHLTREDRYMEGCSTFIDSWLTACRYPRGVNWTSSLELGIRLVNWAFAWHLLGGDAAPLFKTQTGSALKQRWLASVYEHIHFVVGHESRHSSANNHLLGELLGVIIGGTTWPLWPEVRDWCAHASREFEYQALLQNAHDGVNREQAIWYHHEVVDMMLIAGLSVRANGKDFSAEFWNRLEAMMQFVASVMDVRGGVPKWGDSDDAVMVRLYPDPDFSAFRSILATGAVLFGRPDFKAKAARFDDKSRWLLGDAAAAKFDALPNERLGPPAKASFPDAGYYVLGTDFETEHEIRIVADAGPLGYLSIAAHGHADALAFTLAVAGHTLLVDPGTYVYSREKVWREYFRGTSAHNTVRVDGVDQSVSGGSFLWMSHAHATCERFDCNAALRHLHRPSRRLPSPVGSR